MRTAWPPEVQRARDLVLSHGWNATAYQIVNPGIQHWFSKSGDAVVGYVAHSGVRVVAGAPVCPLDQLSVTVEEFERDARSRNSSVCYFGAEARLENLLANTHTHSMVLMGAQPLWSPGQWQTAIGSHASLRAQINRARNKGVTIAEYPASAASTSPQLREVLKQWLKGRGLPPLHFLVEPDTLERLDDRRIFVAAAPSDDGVTLSPVAFAVLSPIPARKGWLVEQFPRLSRAPNGTIELLINEAVRAIGEGGAEYVTLGLAPLGKRNVLPHPPEPAWIRLALELAAAHGKRFYNFAGLEAFKSKFYPAGWEPVFAISSGRRFSPRALYAIAGAFASMSPLRLGATILARAVKDELGRLTHPAQ